MYRGAWPSRGPRAPRPALRPRPMTDPHDAVRPLVGTRQYREFTAEPPIRRRARRDHRCRPLDGQQRELAAVAFHRHPLERDDPAPGRRRDATDPFAPDRDRSGGDRPARRSRSSRLVRLRRGARGRADARRGRDGRPRRRHRLGPSRIPRHRSRDPRPAGRPARSHDRRARTPDRCGHGCRSRRRAWAAGGARTSSPRSAGRPPGPKRRRHDLVHRVRPGRPRGRPPQPHRPPRCRRGGDHVGRSGPPARGLPGRRPHRRPAARPGRGRSRPARVLQGQPGVAQRARCDLDDDRLDRRRRSGASASSSSS